MIGTTSWTNRQVRIASVVTEWQIKVIVKYKNLSDEFNYDDNKGKFYDRNNNKIYWVNGDEFHQKKSVIEEEITLCNKVRFIPITLYDSNNNITNDGIGLVSVGGNN